MKKCLFIIAFSFLFFGAEGTAVPVFSASFPSMTNPVSPLQYFSTLSMKEIQQLAGRKLKLKEKIAVRIFQWKIKKGFASKKGDEIKDKGKTAMIFGIIALSSLLLTPVIFFGPLAATVFALAAIITGNKAIRSDSDNKKAKTGIIMGWITLGLLLILAAMIAVFLTTWTFGWG